MGFREDWKAAKAALDAIEAERDALIDPIKMRFKDRIDAAETALELIEAHTGEYFSTCEGCLEPIFDGDKSHAGSDSRMCEECAPAWADMLSSPEHFEDTETGDPMTPDQAKALCDAHVAAGGSLNDKMVS